MPGPGPQAHWLRRNDSTWTPPRVMFLDSETKTEGSGEVETEVLRCWCARLVRRRDRRRPGEITDARGLTQAEAAETLDRWATEGENTWLYAHNLTFDLVTTNLAAGLAPLGWELSSNFGLTGSAPWMVLHKGRRETVRTEVRHGRTRQVPRVTWRYTLTVTDSFSLMPVRLDTIAAYTTASKPPLPAPDAPMEAWFTRCQSDVEVLAEAVLTVMNYWEDHDLGHWAVTGPACGWNTYRHTITTGDVVIHEDRPILDLEHAACYGGRRDVFRVGDLPTGRYGEIDFTAAYPTIAATVPLPRKWMGTLTPQIAQAILDGRSRYDMLAEVELDTDRPRWPVRARGRVFYPVGRFRTILAGPDIRSAHTLGCLTRVLRGHFYSMSFHMQPWARWVIALAQAGPGEAPGPVRIAAKAWSRSVIGKSAQTGWHTTSFPGPPGDGWHYEECFIAGTTARGSITGLAGQHYLSIADQPGTHEFPALLAFIEAHVRQRLGDVIEAAPAGAIVQCDTDGLMVSYQVLEDMFGARGDSERLAWVHREAIEAHIQDWSKLAAPLVMREKAVFRTAVLYGPQHVVIDGRPRFAGVPASAWQTSEGRWAARLWPGLSWQAQHGDGTGYARPVQDYLVTGPYAAGWVLTDGSVRPVEAFTDPEGYIGIRPWALTRWAARGDRLGANQSAWSRGLWDEQGTRGRPAD